MVSTTGVTNPLYGGLPEIDISSFGGYLGAGKRTGVRGPEGTADFVDSVSNLRGEACIQAWLRIHGQRL